MCEGSAAAVGEALSIARTGAVSLAQCGARGEARRSHPHSPSQLTESRIFGERATVSTDRQAAASHPYVPMFVCSPPHNPNDDNPFARLYPNN